MEKEIGKVTHWYDKIRVAVVRLSGDLKVGEQVKVKHGDAEFTTAIESMQLDHKDVSSAKEGDEIAVKLSQKAKEGSVIFLTE
ncbi:MAG: hypothetical protein A2750_00915 [Candidatus Yanofskybacteria bacterium RIFCSPHIGHO2_01_FULL_45_42]|uniref:Translation elongation factor-like protein n=3 Tax=Candidatus Yanofskyibacteriota TaxID=1752733 RepID=A0A1F8F6Y5_9BACT|nr:MAG: hypothetical protein A2750_00915 [Candidatus Yanofskybacteria bacterium RIFCSPHIGHO2_01_FULL_45_42]OGN15476.1 MAG: hypothetical protein A3C81_01100 [Candidatus Yanofskybacteria bacterium RIFCSPHIGHO2_02_FULL_46_19]OGN27169.1 MAG: hypothetical protein A3B17_01015 [Candidatus Yanofskybacteria bacterium RIFCSPLOWO2_01_FULL_45_72]OGN31845.1 MAG: hypothetical protein A3J01_01645 [Candidatus Yanofskybacteria bacterium RIFCSPLOWO2_02_FULL_45_18]